MPFHIHEFFGSQVIDVSQDQPLTGNSVLADLVFRPRRNLATTAVAGAGIYTICFDETLLYIGKFQGKKDIPFGGNVVRERWVRHMGTLTLRGRPVSMPGQSINRLANFDCHHPAVVGILGADRNVMSKGRGCVSSFNRALFAMQHWDTFSRLDQQALGRFQFLYAQVQPSAVSEDWIRKAVSDLEHDLVARLQPPCNGNVSAERARHHTLEQTRAALEAAMSRLTHGM